MASNITTNGVDTDELYLMRDKVIIDAIQGPAIDEGFQLWAVGGSNDFGQLGTGNTNKVLSPIQIGSDFDWARVTAHGYNTFAIKTNGTLWGWGSNYAGNLGVGDRSIRLTPTQIGTDNDWVDVGVGYSKTFGLKKDGTAWMWGYNYRDSFGIGPNKRNRYLTPIQVASNVLLAPKRMIGSATFFVSKDGNMKAAGRTGIPTGEAYGATNTQGSYFKNCVFATPVPVLPGIYEIDLETRKPIGFEKFYSPAPSARGGWQRPNQAARYYGDYWLVRNNSVYGNIIRSNKRYLDAANGVGSGYARYFGRIAIFENGANYFKQNNYPTYQGNSCSLVITKDRKVAAYGLGRYEVEDGTNTTILREVGFPYTDWIGGAAQAGSFLAIREEGSLWAWGLNFNGILGIGNERQLRRASTDTILTKISDRDNWKSVVMGKKHSMALRRRQ